MHRGETVSHYVHHVPGRLRVRAVAVKGSEEKASAVRALLQSTSGVRSVAANPVTGSVTIHYDQHATSHSALVNLLSERGYFVGRGPNNSDTFRPAVQSSSQEPQIASKLAKVVAGLLIEEAVKALVVSLL